MHFQTHTDNTAVVLKEKKTWCDVFREIMDTEIQQQKQIILCWWHMHFCWDVSLWSAGSKHSALL